MGLPEEFSAVYEVKTGQIILDPRATEFLERVEFAETGQREAERMWRAMENAAEERGPYIYSMTRTGLAKISLQLGSLPG